MTDLDRITQLNHENSPLLKLPPELRNRIYKFALQEAGTIAVYPWKNVDKKPEALTLLSTCRQIYSETSVLYFAINDFGFFHVHNLKEFRRNVAQQKLGAIKSLSLTGDCAGHMEHALENDGLNRLDLGAFASLELIRVCITYPWSPEEKDWKGLNLRQITGKPGLEIAFPHTELVLFGKYYMVNWE